MHHLRSLEADRPKDLPAPIYVRGYVTDYARCLGLNPDRVLADYTDPARRQGDRGAR